MTQAYIEGFCKAAEAYGVDPVQLLKVAQGMPKLLEATYRGLYRINKPAAKVLGQAAANATKGVKKLKGLNPLAKKVPKTPPKVLAEDIIPLTEV